MSSHFLTNHNYSVQPKSSSSPSKIINTIKSTTTNKRKHSYYYPTTTTMASAKIGPTQSPLLANQPKDTINLAVGHPMHSELPNKIISDALKRCGSKLKHNQLDLNYIPSEGPTGAVEELCSFLRRQYKEEEKEEEMRVTGYQAKTEQNENDETKMQSKAGTTTTTTTATTATKNVLQPEDLFFTSGVSHGIEMATSILAKPNDIVVCEKATYFLATKIFEDHDMEITTVKSKRLEEGDTFINPINSILENVGATPRKKRKVLFRPKLVYIVPTHSNPQGVTMPQKAREEPIDFVKLKENTWQKIRKKLTEIFERLFLCLVSLKFSRRRYESVGLKLRILSCEGNFQHYFRWQLRWIFCKRSV